MKWNPFSVRPRHSAEEYLRKIQQLQRELVPPMHEADTLQGELVRCISNLDDESRRNGNMNWDEADEEAVDFLKEHLPTGDVFEKKEIEAIQTALSRVLKAGQSTEDDWFSADDDLLFLVYRVVDYCNKKEKLIHLKEEDGYLGHF